MLYWTCPECGSECSPAVRECPACPPRSSKPRLPARDGILALAQNLEMIHPLPVLANISEHVNSHEENGRPPHSSAATLVEPAAVDSPSAEAAPLVLGEETPAEPSIDSLVRPLVESAQGAVTPDINTLGVSEPQDAGPTVLVDPLLHDEVSTPAAEGAARDPEVSEAACDLSDSSGAKAEATADSPLAAEVDEHANATVSEVNAQPASHNAIPPSSAVPSLGQEQPTNDLQVEARHAEPELAASNAIVDVQTEQHPSVQADTSAHDASPLSVAAPSFGLEEPGNVLPAEVPNAEAEPASSDPISAQAEPVSELPLAAELPVAVSDVDAHVEQCPPLESHSSTQEQPAIDLPAEVLHPISAQSESVSELPLAAELPVAVSDVDAHIEQCPLLESHSSGHEQPSIDLPAELRHPISAQAEPVSELPLAAGPPYAVSDVDAHIEQFPLLESHSSGQEHPSIDSPAEVRDPVSAQAEPVSESPLAAGLPSAASDVDEQTEQHPLLESHSSGQEQSSIDLPADVRDPVSAQAEPVSDVSAEPEMCRSAETHAAPHDSIPGHVDATELGPEQSASRQLPEFALPTEPEAPATEQGFALSAPERSPEPLVSAAASAPPAGPPEADDQMVLALPLQAEQPSDAHRLEVKSGSEENAWSENASSETATSQKASSEPAPVCDLETELTATALECALAIHAEELVGSIAAQEEAEQAAIRTVAASFEHQPAETLLTAPVEFVTAPAPPIFDWMKTPRPAMQALGDQPPAARLAQAQPPTIAGPCLIRELQNFSESQPRKTPRKSGKLAGWTVSLVGATLLVVLLGMSLQYFSAQGDSNTSPTAAPATASSAPGDALAKSVEISGLRLVKSWSGKEQVRFLIVNHSPRDLSGVTLQVAVRAPESAGGAPILMIRAPLHSLGSFESKEIKTDLDSDVPASALTDWQSLHTEVQILPKE